MSLTKASYSMITGAVVNVLDYGAVADNSTNNQAAFQSAINAAVASESAVYIPAGYYKFSSGVTITDAVTIFGDGWGSVIYGTFATGDMFTVTSQDPVNISNIKITSTVNKTAGAAIAFDSGAGTQNNYSVIDSCFFEYQFQGVYCFRSAYQRITNNHFTQNSANGVSIFLGNATTPDAGDQVVANNQIYGGTGVIGISQSGGGGTRIYGNKFLQIQNGYYCQFTGTDQSGIIIVSNNSFDGCTGSSLLITGTGTSIVTDITINGNVFGGSPTNSFMYFQASGSASVGRMAITGNSVIQNTGSQDIITLNKIGDANISSNTFSGAGAITLTSDCVDCVVSNNLLENISVSNASTSTYVANPNTAQTLLSNGNILLGSEASTTVVGRINSYTAANAENVLMMFKLTQVQATIGMKSSTDTNFYVGTGSPTIGTNGVYLTNTGSSWNAVSDERMKTIVETIENAAEKVSSLRAVIGYYNNDEKQIRRPFLIAQDVQAVLPEAVNVQDVETGTLGMSYTDTIPLLVAAIKDLTTRLTALEAKV
ncbi:Pectate lyase superfamily protein [uncultured Caudovirales phage]|uniref:Pectate lyase superfamily protein n=1 Tax=uncultured Caudovirales phage TaxID=2100421 RepID=A0A6J7XFP9_9CAUD|nr:Pectate lyase superfamily protein [uncultured Caudovirales phage]CAB4215907.1 Pectate lyase superfamily protein [uncultured Caudovirales phage]CAB5230130.1 Pectate lyase superfamily protein [uncultured Caudovirales phage]